MHVSERHLNHAPRRPLLRSILSLVIAMLCGAAVLADNPLSLRQDSPATPSVSPAPTLDHARHLFYSGRYQDAAASALAIREQSPEDLATFELRTSAIHFQIRRLLGEPADKDKALKACAECAALMTTFTDDITRGRALARARVEKDKSDIDALFFLGKLDLNYVWLQVGTLGRRTGWNEYREARRTMEDLLKLNASHTRARVARAWIDYIVDTRVTWGFRWMLGGGDKKKGLAVMKEVAASATERFERTEAQFGLWEMNIREKNMPAALALARTLAREYPDNRELVRFIDAQEKASASVKK